MVRIKVYDIFNNVRDYTVESMEKGREHAKRIIMEGFWYIEGKNEVFLPVHEIVKVVISEGEK